MPRRRGRPGLMGTMARTAVIAGTATAVHGAMTGGKKQQQAAAQQQAAGQDAMQQDQLDQMQAELEAMKAKEAAEAQQAAVDAAVAAALAQQAAAAPAAPAAAPAAAAPAAGGDDLTTQLQRLVDMKTQGLLTDEEFAAMKAKLIAG